MQDGVWDSHGMEYGRVMRMLNDGVDAATGPWEMSGLNDRCACRQTCSCQFSACLTLARGCF